VSGLPDEQPRYYLQHALGLSSLGDPSGTLPRASTASPIET
jgi:hypothetical protein